MYSLAWKTGLFSTNKKSGSRGGRFFVCVQLVTFTLQSSLERLVDPATIDMDYAENDVVLCYHGPLLYEAKVRLDVWYFRRDFY